MSFMCHICHACLKMHACMEVSNVSNPCVFFFKLESTVNVPGFFFGVGKMVVLKLQISHDVTYLKYFEGIYVVF